MINKSSPPILRSIVIAAPQALTVIAGDVENLLTWSAVSGATGGGYQVLRSTTSGGPYTQVNGSLINGCA